ncbi:mitochondrial chaperone BCS1 [Cladorrhinum sp. PSN332]|nr:mitochondrial chaperone BCS1 [Cladorrhinum sp. PSN332]
MSSPPKQTRYKHNIPHQPVSGRCASASDPTSRETLRKIAQETQGIVPQLLSQLGTIEAARRSSKHNLNHPHRLHPEECPSFPHPATIKVLNKDTLNVGIQLAADAAVDSAYDNRYPAIVNFADTHRPGGGWLNGALAQEEALCYRSSLAAGLNSKHWPLSDTAAELVYTPYVLVVRDDLASGHRVMELNPDQLPVVSVLSVAAIYKPDVYPLRERYGPPKLAFATDKDRNLTKDKMRLVLRAAARNKHRRLVLGALGCGVYANPPEDVAECWLEVLREAEFKGNWWKEVCFAVYDDKNSGNFETFYRILNGKTV